MANSPRGHAQTLAAPYQSATILASGTVVAAGEAIAVNASVAASTTLTLYDGSTMIANFGTGATTILPLSVTEFVLSSGTITQFYNLS